MVDHDGRRSILVDHGTQVSRGDPEAVGEAAGGQHVVGPPVWRRTLGQLLDLEFADGLDHGAAVGEARPEAGAECDREHPSATAPGTERGLADAGRLGVPGESDPQIGAADPCGEQWSEFETVDRVELVQPADQCPSTGDVEGSGKGEGDTGHCGRGLLDSAIDRRSELPEHDVGTLGGARRDRRPEGHGVGSARFVIGVDDTGLDRRTAHIERRDHRHGPQARLGTLPVGAGLVPVIPSSLPWRDD